VVDFLKLAKTLIKLPEENGVSKEVKDFVHPLNHIDDEPLYLRESNPLGPLSVRLPFHSSAFLSPVFTSKVVVTFSNLEEIIIKLTWAEAFDQNGQTIPINETFLYLDNQTKSRLRLG
jgi:hypothetical protein